MTCSESTAYACVAYRMMECEGNEISEEHMEILLNILYEFYTETEIQKIYRDGVRLDLYDAVIHDERASGKINE
jgi:hypothetical protein